MLEPQGRSRKSESVLYVVPLIIGGIFLLFMVKPLFALRSVRPRCRVLQESDEPALFDLVRRLCDQVGAPFPKRIEVDCEVNASARLRRGLLSFVGHDLVLTIGLPLVAGMSLRQVAGVLAHEFGHFAQGTGMRLGYVIRSINGLFARLVYERDRWDDMLRNAARSMDIRIGIFLWIIIFVVWLARRILWVLLMVGHAVSMFMTREMEHDADAYEIEIAGSRTFAETAKDLRLLTVSRQKALSDLSEAWVARRLATNLPELIVAQRRRMPAEVEREVLAAAEREKGSLFDTHPPDRKRIERALRAEAVGIFTLDVPARAVLRSFDELCADVTLGFYRDALGNEVSGKNLVANEELLRHESEREEDGRRLDAFFHGFLQQDRLFFLADDARVAVVEQASAIEELKGLRARIPSAVKEAEALTEAYGIVASHLDRVAQVEGLHRAKLKFTPSDYGFTDASTGAMAAERRKGEGERLHIVEQLAPVEGMMLRRLTLALQIAQMPPLAEPLKRRGVLVAGLSRMLSALASMRDAYPKWRELGVSLRASEVLFRSIVGNEDHTPLRDEIMRLLGQWRRGAQELDRALSNVAYPFEHAEGRVSLAHYVITALPRTDGESPSVVELADERLHSLYARLMGRLVAVAEAVEEEALGSAQNPVARTQ